MRFEEALQRIKDGIEKPLPGKEAHLKMSPLPVDAKRFDPKIPLSHRRSAVLIMLYPQGKDAFFPLIKRPVYRGAHSGQIALPGGKMEATDSDIVFTALREAEEEVAINPNKVTVLGKLSNLYIPTSNFLVTPILGFSEEIPDFIPEVREVQRILPTALKSLFEEPVRQRTQLRISPSLELDTPFFEIDQEMVWGATAMILSEFLELLQGKEE
ncbi:NUDIX hydrolase [Algoriphagus hitonicola]|uniref:NUDIX domain-containing protein n=1 Tax=Algoriphagus hitonicola TaxID=435880 RepID=A0A1I2TVB8_9BACT|nr:CoA pyrophosphatase [Algoriphagus hitonicola]SFG66486.1 NUDIX domain-containing protein [Algoriphagus hitonicola]